MTVSRRDFKYSQPQRVWHVRLAVLECPRVQVCQVYLRVSCHIGRSRLIRTCELSCVCMFVHEFHEHASRFAVCLLEMGQVRLRAGFIKGWVGLGSLGPQCQLGGPGFCLSQD